MLLVFNNVKHCHLYVLKDHERNRRGYRKIAFAILKFIRKRVITKGSYHMEKDLSKIQSVWNT
jgi:hypothetical protein